MNTNQIKAWFLEGINYSDAPSSLDDLRRRFQSQNIERSALRHAAKWEPLIRGFSEPVPKGWVPLSELAKTSRGIATGANDFFLLSAARAAELSIPARSLGPCVGRANDVSGLCFTKQDFEKLVKADAKCFLLDIKEEPTSAEWSYIKAGETEGITARYILANRKPWFSMEQRSPAPIWAAVFGRGDLGFVFNEVGARSLTNFHCVYPKLSGENYARALTLMLNSNPVRHGARSHTRGYGGGLKKFEPNDLKSIAVPDIRRVSRPTLDKMSDFLVRLDANSRNSESDPALLQAVSDIVEAAGREANSS